MSIVDFILFCFNAFMLRAAMGHEMFSRIIRKAAMGHTKLSRSDNNPSGPLASQIGKQSVWSIGVADLFIVFLLFYRRLK